MPLDIADDNTLSKRRRMAALGRLLLCRRDGRERPAYLQLTRYGFACLITKSTSSCDWKKPGHMLWP